MQISLLLHTELSDPKTLTFYISINDIPTLIFHSICKGDDKLKSPWTEWVTHSQEGDTE